MKKFTLTENAKLQCSCGNSLSELKVTSQTFSKIEGRLEATENDNASGENIFSFGTCSQTKKSCIPEPLQWIGVESWDMIGEGGGLTNHSTFACSLGGTISCKENTQYFHYIGEGDNKLEEDYLSKWEEMANRRRRGDAYVLLKDGTLKKDEDMLEGTVDRIYAVKEDGTGDFLIVLI